MSKQPVVYSVKRWHLVSVVVAIVFVGLSIPVGVMAATGSFVNIRDYANTGATGYSRVVNNRVVTQQCDSATATITYQTCARVVGGRALVGDGAGALTVDGNIQQAPASPYVLRPQGSITSGFYPEGTATVPTGKRFVIEATSILIAVPSGQGLMYGLISVTTAGVTAYFEIPMVYQATYSGNGLAYYSGNSSMRLYADAGSTVTVSGFRDGSTGTASASADLSGYLV